MKVLVACEFSGIVRDSFIEKGHDAISCDLLPTENPGPHYQGCVFDIIDLGFDLIIAHPPCTNLSVSGARWFKYKKNDQLLAIDFVKKIYNSSCPRIAIENPISILSSFFRIPNQIIHPWQFGHGETKATCLWLKNLPLLIPTRIVSGRENRIHKIPPSKNRWKERSRTFLGIAHAMASQWSDLSNIPI